jgi:hypothetical protein
MSKNILAIAMVVVAVTATLGVSAYTTGSVDRSSNVNVVNDDVGLIGLEDGTSGNLVSQNATGALTIDFTNASASGANTAAHFELGNQSNATNQSAFNVTNNDDEARDFSFEYTASDSQDADANIEFQIYNDTGSKQVTVSEESGAVSLSGVASGETYYVVIVVDTHGLGTSADLSGTLKVSA